MSARVTSTGSDSRKSAGAVPVLDAQVVKALPEFVLDVSITLHEGETLVLVGPSGCGKTTTLNLICGLLRPDRGFVRVCGETLTDTGTGVFVPPEHRRIGYVFQDYALFPHLTAEQNIMYGLRARGVPRHEAREIVRTILERFEIAHLAGRRPGALSGGEQQRVALARAVVLEPRILLFDEPLAALDAGSRRRLRGYLRSFLRRSGIPAVIVTHDYEDALALGRRIMVMESGRIIQEGSREEMLLHPRSALVAGFTGVNYFEGVAEATRTDPNEYVVRVGRMQVHAVSRTKRPPGEAAVSFFPSDVILSPDPPHGSARNVFRGPIREIVDLGDRLRVYVEAELPIVAEITRGAADSLDLKEGREVYAFFKATAVRISP